MKKSSIILSLMLALSITAPNITAHAEQTDISKEEILNLSEGLKEILQDKKEIISEEIKDSIIENGWDYDLTMQDLKSENPFKDVNYIELLSAYMSCKNYSIKQGNSNFTYLAYLPLLTYEVEEAEKEEYVPVKIDVYEKIKGTDKYQRSGTKYVIKETVINEYELSEDGYYRRTGTKIVTPEIVSTKYGDVSMKVMSAEDIFSYYGFGEEVKTDFKMRSEILSMSTNSSNIYQTIFARTPQIIQAAKDLHIEEYSQLPIERKRIAEIANSVKGEIPYLWGGKASKPGYDSSWWTFNENNEQKGLDCSGYVQWVYWTAGYPYSLYKKLGSTVTILTSNLPEITEEELQVGDVGVKVGKEYNHTGIYLGKIDGRPMWIHCSSKEGTVTISEFNFHKFYSPLEEVEKNENSEENTLDNINELVYSTDTISNQFYSDEDVYTLAQLIVHEAGGEGLNGWVAVAEVVKNRIDSPLFPNTLQEVVYQEHNGKTQFSSVYKISKITPSQEIIDVARAVLDGRMAILCNPQCLYFRNPKTTSGITVTEPVDWGGYKYYMPIGNHAFYLQDM